jgi:hypothetical protein
MHEKLMKMMAKKRDLSPSEKKAKMDAVHEMRGIASDAMGNKMDGLKKVSVMSNSKQGLAAGLDKAKGIVSQDQEDQMKSNAEAPYGDYKSALDEHNGEDQSDELGRELPAFADGGQVPANPQPSPTPDQLAAQSSMRNAFHFNEGGEVEESPDLDDSSEGYPAREESDDSEDGSPATDSDSSDLDHNDDAEDEMSSEELDAQLAKLMKMKQKMESRRS